MPVKGGDAVAGNCAEQLAKLGLEYVDLYLIHAPFAFAESLACGVEQWRAMLALKEDGTCRAVGVSNYGVHHLEAIKAAGLELPCANQLEIHPLCQQKEIVAW
jgi:diketogulonate reductase-like aldo/keto reductase